MRTAAIGVAMGMVLVACVGPARNSAPDSGTGDTARVEPVEATGEAGPATTVENYPDAQTRALQALARAPRPVDDSALPPRHLDPDRFPEALIDRNRIVSGGVSADGIPSIDAPVFESVDHVDWLSDVEPVVALTVAGETQIHPVAILIWHEIVNTEIAGRPVAVTYCPLCNSVTAFERRIDGRTLDFGTSGALFESALVMYDRQTESLWTHFDGRAVIGTLIGTELAFVPAATISWADAKRDHPDADVLTRDTGVNAPYGESPYANYESIETAPAGFIAGPVDPRLGDKDRVVGIGAGPDATAIPLDRLRVERVVPVQVDGAEFVVFWTPGQTSAIDGERIGEGADVGSTGVFSSAVEGRVLDFRVDEDRFVDDQTGSTWTVTGRAVAGELEGRQLLSLPHLDTFWFAWSAYHPTTVLLD